MESYKKLLLANQAWVQEKTEFKPTYFKKMAEGQKPEFLWIGCSDSRVPAEEITGTEPGELFVHRNIANLVVHTDFNLFSVVEYAVEVLKVKHVIVCGHTGCGGIRASLDSQREGILGHWLRYIKDTYSKNEAELLAIKDTNALVNRMVELNVQEQIDNLAKTSFVQRVWKDRGELMLHGWVYDMESGKLQPTCSAGPDVSLKPMFRVNFNAS